VTGAAEAIVEAPVTIPALDAYPLGGWVLEPAAPRAVLQLQGGTGIPREFYARFARYAAEHGYLTVLFDYRGIGASRPRSLRGFEAHMRWWGERDMPGVLEWVKARYPGLPRLILGHSAGAQLYGLMPNHADVEAVLAIAAGSGYWRELKAPYRYFTLLIWYGIVPVSLATLGYVPARRLRLGEDLPRGVALEWRDWCLNAPYLGARLGDTIRTHFYDEVTTPIAAWAMTDDPIAHPASSEALFRLYRRAPITHVAIRPEDVGGAEIGHAGFFRPRFRDTLWRRALDWLDRQVADA